MKNMRYLLLLTVSAAAFAQPSRILSKIDPTQRVILAGNVHASATAANDAGAVDSSFAVPFITLNFKPTADQQANLNQLLIDQQNPASGRFRQWLTPEQYADQFGLSTSDLAQVAAWLQSQGFQVNPLSRSRTYLTFSGTAGQVQSAFGTAIHHYVVNGKTHFANATDPTVPAALAPLVQGFRGLTDFHPTSHIAHAPKWSLGGGQYAVAPDDFATIYNVSPMYTAGYNGSGMKIVIPGQSELYNSGKDTTKFWSTYGISSTLVQTLVPGSPNPEIVPGDLDEASLDTQWSGAVARGATIEFYYSEDAFDSAQYAVDNVNQAGEVLSISYGACEAIFGFAQLPSIRQMVQQANAEGMTWTAAAGDTGAADCENTVNYTVNPSTVAEGGLAVDAPGSIPEVTSMGGTMLATGGAYWSLGNSSTDESAKAYSNGEESAWNETAESISEGGSFLAGGGGASMFFPQPSWQTGIPGMPNDGWRHVPDLSFNASAINTPLVIYCGSESDCDDSNGVMEFIGGTSASAPTMAGVVAILNQYLGTKGLGNINPSIYALSQSTPSAFHDITTGNNMVPCAYGAGIYNAPGCNSNGEEGYSAVAGYDQATGVGSLNVTNFIQQFHTAIPTGAIVEPSLDQDPVYQGTSESCGNSAEWNFELTLSEEGGVAATVTGFTINGTSYASQINAIFNTSSIGARQSISGCVALPNISVPANETLAFSGTDANGNPWSTAITVPFTGPLAPLSISGVSNAASGQTTFAPGQIMSVYGTGLGIIAAGQAAGTIPLPIYMAGLYAFVCPGNCNTGTNYNAPLYYVGPNQVNLQIPYEITGGRAQLEIYTPYSYSGITYNFSVASTAPGIFMTEDGTSHVANGVSTSANPGQAYTLYITGQGQLTPQVGDGYSPPTYGLSGTPKPTAAVSVTVGGIAVAVDANWFVGVPSWSVGVTQINFTIPASVPAGNQQVVVTVGSGKSAPAYITIN